MTGPLITGLPLWQRHEQRVLTVLRGALLRLQANGLQGRGELELNEDFLGCIYEENERNRTLGRDYVDHPLVHDGLNPITPSAGNASSGRKRPDLQWQILDHGAPNPRYSVRSFAIECKRLGNPPPKGRNLNGRYVVEGVHRFRDPDFQYGRDVSTGAMVGYIQSSTPRQTVSSVDAALQRRGFPVLTPLNSSNALLLEMDHSFKRTFKASPFRLVHLWIT